VLCRLRTVDANLPANRPPGMSFLIDQFLAFAAGGGNFFPNAIDPNRIGASGHSFGGYTVLALAGGAGPAGTFTHPRGKTILPQTPPPPLSDALFARTHLPPPPLGGAPHATTPFPAHPHHPPPPLPPAS